MELLGTIKARSKENSITTGLLEIIWGKKKEKLKATENTETIKVKVREKLKKTGLSEIKWVRSWDPLIVTEPYEVKMERK